MSFYPLILTNLHTYEHFNLLIIISNNFYTYYLFNTGFSTEISSLICEKNRTISSFRLAMQPKESENFLMNKFVENEKKIFRS